MRAASLSLIGITVNMSGVCGLTGRVMAELNLVCAAFTQESKIKQPLARVFIGFVAIE